MILSYIKAALVLGICSVFLGCATVAEQPLVEFPLVNDSNFEQVIAQDGAVLILFADSQQSGSSLANRFDNVATVNNDIRFAKFLVDDQTDLFKYKVSSLPTIGLYSKGYLIDQVSGEPSSYDETYSMDRDFTIWMNKTVVPLSVGSKTRIVYRFNNSSKMKISAY